jgi:hypothetical protein
MMADKKEKGLQIAGERQWILGDRPKCVQECGSDYGLGGVTVVGMFWGATEVHYESTVNNTQLNPDFASIVE